MADSKIIERIQRETEIPNLLNTLTEKLNPSDLQSLLLEVYRQRAQHQTPAAVLGDYETNRFVRPSSISPLDILEWEQSVFKTLPTEFQPITLSPVTPLGTSSAIGLVDQNRVLSTIRNTEVVSDSTNVLALEAAVQRRSLLKKNPKSKERVHLAASHRLLRTQNYNNPKAISHFAIFSLCSAGQDEGNLQFELSTMKTHISVYLRALRLFFGADQIPLRVSIADFGPGNREARLEEEMFDPLRTEFTNLTCELDSEDKGQDYYVGFRFHIHAQTPEGGFRELADGGPVNWTQKLLSNAKERCVISGIGSEGVCSLFNQNSK